MDDLAVLFALGDSVRFVVYLRRGRTAVDGRPEQAEAPITPDQAREHMLTPRQLAAKAVRGQVKMFCDEGNPAVAMTLLYDAGDKATIGHLLEYQRLGWRVEFHRDYATMSLPAVLS